VSEWYDDHQELAALLRFLDERTELVGWDADDFIRFVDEPWKWTPEYLAMFAEERNAVHD
jgi:hypothetical protein